MSAARRSVVITGGRGLVGSALAARLRGEGSTVVVLTRDEPRGPSERRWEPLTPEPALFRGAEAVVHLLGATIGVRWTPARLREIRASRVDTTRALVEALARTAERPATLIAASAIGIYGDRGNEELDETSSPGRGVLADLAFEWEAAAAAAAKSGMRVVRVRFGLVLSRSGGVLARMLPIFRLGLGGPIGHGRQWWSWIAIDDLAEVLRAVIGDGSWTGALNAVTPAPVTSQEFARALGRALGRPALIPAPAPMLRLLFGAMADETMLASQRVRPRALSEHGWSFRHPGIDDALRSVLSAPARAP